MKTLRRLIAGLIGFPLLVFGIILIPLPGPGLLLCFIALFVLSFGFDWAQTYYDKAKSGLISIYKKAKQQSEKIEDRLNKR